MITTPPCLHDLSIADSKTLFLSVLFSDDWITITLSKKCDLKQTRQLFRKVVKIVANIKVDSSASILEY